MAEEDAPVVALQAGAIIVELVSVGQFSIYVFLSGWSSDGGLTTNTTTLLAACGSSSSGAAVGSGLVDIALGTGAVDRSPARQQCVALWD